jgi:hypothetical protein
VIKQQAPTTFELDKWALLEGMRVVMRPRTSTVLNSTTLWNRLARPRSACWNKSEHAHSDNLQIRPSEWALYFFSGPI